ncbi:hypothetical protein H4CHR_02881 [Variovorax sp. PBS-H4]|uniref:hypothetical protein n=1 Tax=Variovorax sp. PBS-H4 TaxID=434008 RepID=UPI001317C5AC|nr:hypothetical protein [Variovorax sp. PBS-H4]VTU31799.1 hypothetical protein H4CHR_02881 [Variovorax sp. PBS-H4]
MSSDLQYKLGQLEYRAGQEPQFTEAEHFVAEHMLQLDFEMLNDEGTVYGCTLGQILELLRARGGAVERSSSPLQLSVIRKWPEGFEERLNHVWSDVVSYIPNVKLYDLQRILAQFGFEMTITEKK